MTSHPYMTQAITLQGSLYIYSIFQLTSFLKDLPSRRKTRWQLDNSLT